MNANSTQSGRYATPRHVKAIDPGAFYAVDSWALARSDSFSAHSCVLSRRGAEGRKLGPGPQRNRLRNRYGPRSTNEEAYNNLQPTYTYPQPLASKAAPVPGSKFNRQGGSKFNRRGQVLARQLPWDRIEQALAPKFAPQDRAAKPAVVSDLLGEHALEFGGGISNAGRPRLSIRLMASLLYLKNAFNLSDEELVQRWSENVVWQFFSGMDYYEPRLPCDATQIGRFRRAIGEEGLEQLLKSTIETAVETKAVKPAELERVIVDTTVQEKAIAHPVDSRLLEIARHKVVSAARRAGIALKQTFVKEGKELQPQGRRLRPRQAVQAPEEDRQAPAHDPGGGDARGAAQARCADPGHCRRRSSPSANPRDRRRWASCGCGCSVPNASAPSNVTTRTSCTRCTHPRSNASARARRASPTNSASRSAWPSRTSRGLMVGARSFPGNPFDGHILSAQLEQATNLMQDLGRRPTQAIVDLGFRGVDADNPGVEIIHRGKYKTLTNQQRRWLKRRQAIEPMIGHTKSDNRMERCWLPGALGDALHALSCAAGYNIRWLMRAIVRLAAKRLSLAQFGLALYGQISGIGAGSAVSGAVAALRQAIGQLVGFSAPRRTLAIQVG